LNFESIDLSRIVVKLERYYDIKIRLQDPLMGSKKITGKLKLKEDRDKVLNVLALTASLKLTKINEQNYVLK
jgi:ferric-dicitrate binding protein FerR (iron transport regulator)